MSGRRVEQHTADMVRPKLPCLRAREVREELPKVHGMEHSLSMMLGEEALDVLALDDASPFRAPHGDICFERPDPCLWGLTPLKAACVDLNTARLVGLSPLQYEALENHAHFLLVSQQPTRPMLADSLVGLTRIDDEAENEFYADNLVLKAGSILYIDFAEWKGDGSGLKIGVDLNGDGEIDETYEAEDK